MHSQDIRFDPSARVSRTEHPVALVASHDPAILTLMGRLLGKADFHVVQPPHRGSIVTSLRLLRPTVCFLDTPLAAPPSSEEPGDALWDELERVAQHSSVPLWILADEPSLETVHAAMQRGARGFLRKSDLAKDLEGWLAPFKPRPDGRLGANKEASPPHPTDRAHALMVEALEAIGQLPGVYTLTLAPNGKVHTSDSGFEVDYLGPDKDLFSSIHPADHGQVEVALQGLLAPSHRATLLSARLIDTAGSSKMMHGMCLRIEPHPSDNPEILLVLLEGNASGMATVLAHHLGQLEGRIYNLRAATHDFRNLLWLLEMQASILKLEPSPEDLDMVAEHLRTAVRQGLELTQIAECHVPTLELPPLARQPIATIVRDLGLTLKHALPRRIILSVKIHDEVSQTNPPIQVALTDVEVRRCLLNLVINARDAIPDTGTIEIRVEKSKHVDQGVALTVCDSGCGISEADQSKLFEMGFSSKGSAGNGLGLAIVHALVSRVGGAIHVDSHPGGGTRFTLHLPTSDVLP